MAIATACKPLTMAASYFLSNPSILSSKTPNPFLPIPFKPIKFNLSCSHSSSLFSSPQSLKHKSHFQSTIRFVIQTPDLSQQVQQNPNSETLENNETEEEPFIGPNEEAKVFVGNLPYDVDSEKLAMLFEKAGIVEISEVIYNRETDQSRGFGFVTMSTIDEAEKAMEMFHNYDVGGRILTVNKAAPRGSQPERALEPVLRIYAGNLPWNVDSTQLEQVFSEHGTVVEARVVSDRETGRSRGFGFVTMSDSTDVTDVIAALDGQSLDGRTIRASVAEERPRRTF